MSLLKAESPTALRDEFLFWIPLTHEEIFIPAVCPVWSRAGSLLPLPLKMHLSSVKMAFESSLVLLYLRQGRCLKFIRELRSNLNHLCTADNCVFHLLNLIIGVSFKHLLKRVLALRCSEKVHWSIVLFLPEVNHLPL